MTQRRRGREDEDRELPAAVEAQVDLDPPPANDYAPMADPEYKPPEPPFEPPAAPEPAPPPTSSPTPPAVEFGM